ncbi:MAG: glycoside hydrolase domain-containing protein [Acidimicrobiales bacterium]
MLFRVKHVDARIQSGSVRSYLADVGFGFMPLYLGMQEGDKKCPSCNTLTTAQGTDDANRASNLMAAAGFANGAVCWLDVELGGTLSAAFIDYISAWVSELNNHTDYWAGVYCSYDETAAQIATACGADNVNFWVWDLNIDSCQEDTPFPTPSPSSAYSNATALQYAQNCTISNGVTTNGADLDSSVYSDPSINPIQG